MNSSNNYKKENYQLKLDCPTNNIALEDQDDVFAIFNYLQSPIQIKDYKTGNLLAEVEQQKHKIVKFSDLCEYLFQGNVLQILYKCSNSEDSSDYIHHSLYTVGGNKAIHIGMIVSRYREGTTFQQIISPIQGLPFIDIHNLTDVDLVLNNGRIHIPPKGNFRYKGQNHVGVPLGTYLTDDHSMFQDFQILKPISDIFFGVISDLDTPSFQGSWVPLNDKANNPYDPEGKSMPSTYYYDEIKREQPTYLFADGWY